MINRLNSDSVPVVGTELRLVNVFGGKRKISCLYIVDEDRIVKAKSDDHVKKIISIIELADGKRTVKQICDIASEKYPDINAFDLLNKLAAYSVFNNVSGARKYSEVSIFSKSLVNINMSRYSNVVYKFRRIFWGIPIVFIVACVGLLFCLEIPIQSFSVEKAMSSYRVLGTVVVKLYYYLLSYLLMFPMFILHEMSHVTMASKYGLVENQFCIALYLGFIPMYYIRIRGIYTVSTGKRIAIMLAGPLVNIFVGIIFYMAFRYSGSGIMLSLAQSNIRIGMVNIIPLSLTDGYYLLCSILGQINLRKKIYLFMVALFCRKKIIKLKSIEIIYMITSLVFTYFFIMYEMWIILRMVLRENNIKMYIILLSTLIMLIYLFVISKVTELRYSSEGGQ